jgi:hypothetical protein
MFESVALPPDTVLLPGVISHATNIVEHPETIADRIIRFAERVGRENVVASADCGFSCQASYTPEIHPRIVWAKFEALAEGARLRTSHADRDQAIDRLKAAFVRGRLTKDELVARTAQACSARTYADLAALTADLPAEPPAAKSPSQPVVLVLGVPAATVVAVPIVVALKLEARRRNRSRGQLPPRPTPGTRTQAQRPTTQPPPTAIQPPPIAIQPPPIAIQPPPIDRDHPAAEAARPRSPSPRHPAIAYASS